MRRIPVERAFRAAFQRRPGCATAIELATGRTLARWRPDLVKNWAAAPGSVIKPLVAAAGAAEFRRACPRGLVIDGIRLDCTHSPSAQPLDMETALALSCNCWMSAYVERLDPEALRRALSGADFTPPATLADRQLAALGVRGVRITPAWLAGAYLRLLRNAAAPIRRGLERAVREGTALAAQPALGGKTGTSREAAWFAGYDARLLLVVALPAGSGGGDAAPVAGEVFSRCAG